MLIVQHRSSNNAKPSAAQEKFLSGFINKANRQGSKLINWTGIKKGMDERQSATGCLKQYLCEELDFDPTKPGKLHSVREAYTPFLPEKGNIRKNILALLPQSTSFLEHWEKPPIAEKAKAERAKARESHFDKAFSIFCDAPSKRDAPKPSSSTSLRAGG